MSRSETKPPNTAGAPFSLAAIRAFEWIISKLRRRAVKWLSKKASQLLID
jgi:hypothetical protein